MYDKNNERPGAWVTTVVSGTVVGCQGATCEVLRIASKDGEKRDEDGVFEFERKSREMRRVTRMRTSLPVGGGGAISSTCRVENGASSICHLHLPKYVQIIQMICDFYFYWPIIPVQSNFEYFFLNSTVRLPFIRKSTRFGLRHRRASISSTFPMISPAK